jgi:hypothetical protein
MHYPGRNEIKHESIAGSPVEIKIGYITKGNSTTSHNNITLTYRIGRAIAQAVSRRLLTAETRFAPRSVHVGFVVEKVALGKIFLPVFRFFPVSIIPPLLHIYSCIIWGLDKGPIRGQVPQRHNLNPSQQ